MNLTSHNLYILRQLAKQTIFRSRTM